MEELVAELEETPVEIIEIVEEQEEEIVDATPTIDKENIEKLNMAEKLMDIASKGSLFDAAEMHALLSSFGAEMELRDINAAYSARYVKGSMERERRQCDGQ